MRISDWSSDVCSSDLIEALGAAPAAMPVPELPQALQKGVVDGALIPWEIIPPLKIHEQTEYQIEGYDRARFGTTTFQVSMNKARWDSLRSEEHTSELQSLMRLSYAVFCLKKKKKHNR